MKILVTGAAGFIGSAVSIKLLEEGYEVLGVDNHNDYYDVSIKEARLARHLKHERYSHERLDISDKAQRILIASSCLSPAERSFKGIF